MSGFRQQNCMFNFSLRVHWQSFSLFLQGHRGACDAQADSLLELPQQHTTHILVFENHHNFIFQQLSHVSAPWRGPCSCIVTSPTGGQGDKVRRIFMAPQWIRMVNQVLKPNPSNFLVYWKVYIGIYIQSLQCVPHSVCQHRAFFFFWSSFLAAVANINQYMKYFHPDHIMGLKLLPIPFQAGMEEFLLQLFSYRPCVTVAQSFHRVVLYFAELPIRRIE